MQRSAGTDQGGDRVSKHDAATGYIRRIRNEAKRRYAYTYWKHLLGYYNAPARPATLSFMAAQAVEMQLRELVKEA
jgi:hypothetical protein